MIKSDKIRLFQLILQDEFNLKHRINFAKNKVIRFDGDPCMGMYEGTKFSEKKINHKIRLSTSEIKSDRQLFCTLAHEYVHAWQMENNQDLGHDTKTGFTQWRKYFNDTYKVDIVYF
jgi:Zn-dependent peptidase ImmA (M78 family)